INDSTVRFGTNNALPVSVASGDVNGDGSADKTYVFNSKDIGWRCGQTTATLTGMTTAAQSFSGTATVIVGGFGNAQDSPVATGQTLTTAEDTPLPITLSAQDPNGGTLVFTITTPPSHGTAVFNGSVSCVGTAPSVCTRGVTYTPNLNFNGTDTFTYQVD